MFNLANKRPQHMTDYHVDGRSNEATEAVQIEVSASASTSGLLAAVSFLSRNSKVAH